MKKNIYLIGYMGTGKSTIGRSLAESMGTVLFDSREKMTFVDMDALIEEEQGKAISTIFAEEGEEAFRDMETDLLKTLSGKNNLIVSCGGGVPLRAVNADLMKSSGTVIWLDAKPETIYKRLKNDDTRPLLKDNMTLEHIRDMQAARKTCYEQAATHHLYVDDLEVNELVLQVLSLINTRTGGQ